MRKPRLVDGRALPVNLYPHQRHAINRWRYRRPDGSWLHFEARLDDAIAAAEQLNAQFSAGVMAKPDAPKPAKPGRLSFDRHRIEFEAERERRDPSLTNKKSWQNRKSSLRQFCKIFAGRAVSHITLLDIQPWWDALTGNAQRSRKPELQRFFNYLMARKLCPLLDANPFSSSDVAPRVEMTPPQPKARQRLSIEAYWKIYDKAAELGMPFVQIAMGLSLITTFRRGDICDLRFDAHIEDGILRKRINKSHAQLADPQRSINASNLLWRIDDDPELKRLINRARELSLMHGRCPYLISFRPKQCHESKVRKHTHQVLADYLSEKFSEARDATGIFKDVPVAQRPTFHEIRGLSSHLYKSAGYETTAVQELMAHTDEKMTMRYQAGHAERWTEIGLKLPSKVMGRGF